VTVNLEGIIRDGNHAVRAAIEDNRTIDVFVVDYPTISYGDIRTIPIVRWSMNRREEITEVLSRIIYTALVRIRAAGWSGDPKRCALEADHVHNIPAIIANGSEAALQFYWDVERTEFMAKASHIGEFEPLWSRLESLLEQHATS
jgi:hypothetical protein